MKNELENALKTLSDIQENINALCDKNCENDELSSWLLHVDNHLYEAIGGIKLAIKCKNENATTDPICVDEIFLDK